MATDRKQGHTLSEIQDIINRGLDEGEITDADRVTLYEIAMSIATHELHRIETNAVGTVNPAALVGIEKIVQACTSTPTPFGTNGTAEQED